MSKKRKQRIILIGDGAVGSSFAFASVLTGVGRELGIIDLNGDRVDGDVLDLIDAGAYAAPKRIFHADYADCGSADIVVITAGAAQKPGETRLDLVHKNTRIFKGMIEQVVASGFQGIFLIATNPVDVLSYWTWKFSGFPPEKIIGSGTALDSARFRQEIAQILDIDSRNVHGYILGEHGDTEFPVWSQANVGGMDIYQWVRRHKHIDQQELVERFYKVRDKAYEIIDLKGATYYGVAAALARICRAILNDENAVLPVSILMDGHFGLDDVFISAPAVVGSEGVREVVEINLNDQELQKMQSSAQVLKETIQAAREKLEEDA
ncbi:L-lactate dehydrogenase [Aerococcus urinaehominis]|uniref:L-lactate dehydrogenase n=1 Tax=Aerococcus urinaehominis TaxID=128944 RepID=A0A109RGF4_9LACT|nr:L-lactate dehydrogenase [Aerococcus urinaehominis]AMB99175.1 L-lactate dehydrogenase [Aerococcus urinaehominis]SDM06326.1 L-lactate dehydrogenase [Aerococcus urinaehominis]